MKYKPSDAWILVSTIYAGRKCPATLSDVIAWADAIQHAIVTFTEMKGALARLTSGGFIMYRDGKLSPAPRTLKFYRTVDTPRITYQKAQEHIERLLATSSSYPLTKLKKPNTKVLHPTLTQKQFNEATREHLAQ
jgi:hypothetical protein